MTPDRSHSDTVERVANKVRVEGGEPPSTLTSTFRNVAFLAHSLRQTFFFSNFTSEYEYVKMIIHAEKL